ncbi:hypothetical protein J2W96_007682 [Variovorax guangxiensis]|nr:hypothetical protein [Variovorax guangxiensis]
MSNLMLSCPRRSAALSRVVQVVTGELRTPVLLNLTATARKVPDVKPARLGDALVDAAMCREVVRCLVYRMGGKSSRPRPPPPCAAAGRWVQQSCPLPMVLLNNCHAEHVALSRCDGEAVVPPRPYDLGIVLAGAGCNRRLLGVVDERLRDQRHATFRGRAASTGPPLGRPGRRRRSDEVSPCWGGLRPKLINKSGGSTRRKGLIRAFSPAARKLRQAHTQSGGTLREAERLQPR